jgi:ketosteroid isomerase-like protein
MSEQEQNIEVVKKGYEAFISGDMETLMSLLDDNIEWIQPGQSAVSGTYHGKGELGEYISRLAEKSTTVNPHRFIADGDTVVVLSETTSGGETSQDADVFTLRDGKLVRAQVYGDTGIMERVFGKKQLAGSGTD